MKHVKLDPFGAGRFLAGCALLALAAAPSQANVLVVSTAAGSTYTTIQAAVNAAVDGDVILVKPATSYAGFTITDKALTVAGDTATTINVTSGVRVISLAAARTVVLSRLSVRPPAGLLPAPALTLAAVSGQVRVHACTLTGNRGQIEDFGCYCGTPGGDGADVQSGTGGIAFEACTITGGAGGGLPGDPGGFDPGGAGGHGLRIRSARVAVYDCTLRGGDGGDLSLVGGDAGDAVNVSVTTPDPAQVLLSNCAGTGGRGGHATDWICQHCHHSGDGGDGLVVGPGALAMTLDSTFAGGAPGGCLGPCLTTGATGVPIVNNGMLTPFAVSRVAMQAPTIVRAGTTMSLALTADPGDQVFLFEFPRTSFVGIASWRGFWLAKPTGLNLYAKPPQPLATLPGTGTTTVNVPAPELGPGTQGRTHFYQAYRVAPSGSITLGSFAAVTVVQPGF